MLVLIEAGRLKTPFVSMLLLSTTCSASLGNRPVSLLVEVDALRTIRRRTVGIENVDEQPQTCIMGGHG